MKNKIYFLAIVALGLIGFVPAQAGSLEPPPGPVSPTRPPDTCFDNTGNRFVDCGDGTIKDTETDLYWLKNANCFTARNWSDASTAAAELAQGQCGLTDGSLPGDWRLPTVGCPSGVPCPGSSATGEFGAMLNLASANGCAPPTVPDTQGTGCWTEGNPFSGVQLPFYWSATTDPGSSAWALGALLTGGVETDFKPSDYSVWPVRSGP